MPANLLIFDADYVSELTAKMNTACELMAEAVSSLKSASNHENWKCKERTKISESFGELNTKLGRLDNGVNEVTRILGGSVSRFASLESQYDSQANNLSDELTNNYGFRAAVRTGDGTGSGTEAASVAGSTAAGAGAAGQAVSSAGDSSRSDKNTGTRTGTRTGNGAAAAAAFRIPGRGRPSDNNTNTSAGTDARMGGSSMNVNLPVTHIPDNPGAAARGVKDTQDIANAALNSVVNTMTEALGANSGDHGSGLAARLADTYNAGRSVFESCSVILANPSQPHTSERLTMAAGLVKLAENSGAVKNTGNNSNLGLGDLSRNAGLISSALQDDSETSEFKSLLEAITNQSSNSGSSGGEELSFFDMIIEELKKVFSENGNRGGSSSSSRTSLASSSPVMEFLGSFVMDQAV